MLAKAVAYAAAAHGATPDGAGVPYILHPMRVATTVGRFAEELEQDVRLAETLAMLHDVVEDTTATLHGVAMGVGLTDVGVAALRDLTHLPDEPYDAYLDRVLVNPLASAVKVADVEDNGDPMRLARLAQVDEIRARRLRFKYDRAAARLEAAWSLRPWWAT